MLEPIINAGQITPKWLTGRLRRGGHLTRGGVSQIGVDSFKTLFSHIHRLEVSYSADAAATAARAPLPAKLLLKVPLSDNEDSLKMGKDEVEAYAALALMMSDPPIVRCFDALYSTDSQESYLLLEDLSDTHFQPEMPLPPSERHCERCVESLAGLHAFWWEHEGLGTKVGQLYDAESLREIVTRLELALRGFFTFMGDRLSPQRVRIYERAIEFVPAFWQRRLTSRRHNTLIHGDAHQWNMLHPKDVERGRAYLIDLATTNRVRPPTNDLAYMMAIKWYPERRAVMEAALLRHYHAALVSRGVQNYSWEDCLVDYRGSVVTHLFTPIFQWAGGQIPAAVWWPNLERISEAYKDLCCDELV